MGNVFDDIRESSQAKGEAIGEAKGEERGRAIGAHTARVEVAIKMIQNGKTVLKDVADMTGLTLEEVSELAQKESA